jgi:ABC-type amino acid transport substrate-binding protein
MTVLWQIRSVLLDPADILRFCLDHSTFALTIAFALLGLIGYAVFSGAPSFAQRVHWLVRSRKGNLTALLGLSLIAWLFAEIVFTASRTAIPVPVIVVEQDTFIGEPLLLNWEYDRSATPYLGKKPSEVPIVFEVESARDDFFSSELARYPLSEGYYRIFRHINASRFWRVRTISKQNYQPISDWSQPVRITQYDSVYRRIAATNQVLVFVSHSEYEDMFKWTDRNSYGFTPKGFEISFSKAIIERLGALMNAWLEPRFTAVSWPELLNTPGQGRADMIIGAITKRRQRERDFRISFSETYFCTVQSLIYRVGEPVRSVRDMIRGKRVGYQRNTTSEQLVLELAKDTSIEQQPFDRLELLIQSILDQNLDFGVTDSPFTAVQEFARRATGGTSLDHQDFRKADFPSSIPEDQQVEEYAIAMRAGDSELLHAINGIINTMKQQGTLLHLLVQANKEYQEANGLHPDSAESEMGEHPWECPH